MAELCIENLKVTFPDTPAAVLDIAQLRVAAVVFTLPAILSYRQSPATALRGD